MELIIYVLLGILQGFTEPLPISSSGHLILFRNVFNIKMIQDLNFEIVVHFGSFIALFYIFRKEIVKLLKAFFGYLFKKKKRESYKKDFRYCLFILLGCIPVGVAGLFLKDFLDLQSNNMRLLGISFLFTALILFLIRKKNGEKKEKDITFKNVLFIGILQIIALIPGISRSGTVLIGCLLCGFSRKTALKYTFMLYFPISLASMSLSVLDLLQSNQLNSLLLYYSSGLIAAGVVTYFSYQWLSKLVLKGKLWKFSIYCLILGSFVLFYFR